MLQVQTDSRLGHIRAGQVRKTEILTQIDRNISLSDKTDIESPDSSIITSSANHIFYHHDIRADSSFQTFNRQKKVRQMWDCRSVERAVRDILYFFLLRTINMSHSYSNLSSPVGPTPSPRDPYPASPLTGLTGPSVSVPDWARPPGHRGTTSGLRTYRGSPTIGTTELPGRRLGRDIYEAVVALLLLVLWLLPALRVCFNESSTGWHYEDIYCISFSTLEMLSSWWLPESNMMYWECAVMSTVILANVCPTSAWEK